MSPQTDRKPASLEGLWPMILAIGMSLLVAMFSEVIAPAHAEEPAKAKSFWDDRERGWFWYEDPARQVEEKSKEPETKETKKEEMKTDGSTLSKNPELRALQVKVKEALDNAVAQPTEQNVVLYFQAKQEADRHASQFTDQYRRVLWKYPEYDLAQVHPTNTVGSRIDRTNDKSLREEAARALAQTDGIFFFFKESCPYCVAQAPILKSLAERFGINVVAISLDGSRIPEFPDAVDDIGWADRMGVTMTPTMLMVNPSSGSIEALAYGLTTEDDLLNRIYVISQARLGQF